MSLDEIAFILEQKHRTSKGIEGGLSMSSVPSVRVAASFRTDGVTAFKGEAGGRYRRSRWWKQICDLRTHWDFVGWLCFRKQSAISHHGLQTIDAAHHDTFSQF